MRTMMCAAAATIFLGLGTALLLQGTRASSESLDATLEQTRPPSESLEATLKPTRTPSESLEPTLERHEAIAAAPDLAAGSTPIAFRQVQSVSIIEPAGGALKDPAGAPAETARTDYREVEASSGAALDEERSATAPNANSAEATQDVTRPQKPRKEDVSSSDRFSRKAS